LNSSALHKISYGMYIITSRDGDKQNGQTANTVVQITSEPATIAISINKQNLTHLYIQKSKMFAVCVLEKDTPLDYIGRFGFKTGRNLDKLAGLRLMPGRTGAPVVLDHTVAFLEAEVVGSLDCGTHTIFLGKVLDCDIVSPAEPMTYAYYHEVKRGTSPKTAPTYVKPMAAAANTPPSPKWQCNLCAYIYDPALGDPAGGIAPGTPFEQIPENWVCPICGATKDQFIKLA
jgi:flavin reductase (DIM6/NTAB) family NADH-FMN oxidoreductase RutF/rubredoxin